MVQMVQTDQSDSNLFILIYSYFEKAKMPLLCYQLTARIDRMTIFTHFIVEVTKLVF